MLYFVLAALTLCNVSLYDVPLFDIALSNTPLFTIALFLRFHYANVDYYPLPCFILLTIYIST